MVRGSEVMSWTRPIPSLLPSHQAGDTPTNTQKHAYSPACHRFWERKTPEGCGITANSGIRRAAWRRGYLNRYLQKNYK